MNFTCNITVSLLLTWYSKGNFFEDMNEFFNFMWTKFWTYNYIHFQCHISVLGTLTLIISIIFFALSFWKLWKFHTESARDLRSTIELLKALELTYSRLLKYRSIVSRQQQRLLEQENVIRVASMYNGYASDRVERRAGLER